jgi:tripartite-type tricarboxylate transporter receptor subunit TctC
MGPRMRSIVSLLALLASLLAGSGQAVEAQPYPTAPVRIVVTISAGSTADILARAIGDKLSRSLGQPVVIENRPGAGGNIAGAYVAKEPADGHTLLLATISSHGINPSMFGAKMPYDALADFAHIIAIASVPNMLIANNDLPIASAADFVRLAKSKPGGFSYSSGGNGTSHHLAAELFNTSAGIKTTHIPYRGTPEAVTAVIRGDAAIMFPNAPNAEQLATEGKLKALAVTSARRLQSLPNVPTMIELGFPDFEVVGWYGMVGRAGTPPAIVKRLNAELQQIMDDPATKDVLRKNGFEPMGGSPEDFANFNRAEIEKWRKVVQPSGARVE